MEYNVYILKCNDDSLYTGIAFDLKRRLLRHNQGKGAKYTKARLPVELTYFESSYSKNDAIKREFEIKRFSRDKKMKLIRFGRGSRVSLGNDIK